MAAEPLLIRGEAPLEVEHFDPGWRLPLPGGEPRLSVLTALAYFAETTFATPGFYEQDCDNELAARLPDVEAALARVTAREAALFEPGRWSCAEYTALRNERQTLVSNALRGLRGHQYELVLPLTLESGAHRVYVVRKVRRTNPSTTEPMAAYSIVDGVIRRAPDLHALVESRLARAAFHLTEAVGAAEALQRARMERMARLGRGAERGGDGGDEAAADGPSEMEGLCELGLGGDAGGGASLEADATERARVDAR